MICSIQITRYFFRFVCLYEQEWSFKLMYKRQPLLTKNIDKNCTVHWNSNSIVSYTAVCSNKIFPGVCNHPGISNKQYFTVSPIIQNSSPSNVWGWFTSCIAEQNQTRALSNSLVIANCGYPR